jgi:enoyl-CoA hydratase/carnithine racemase
MTQVVQIEDRDRVRILTMNRPDKLNALDNALTTALLDALLQADADAGVHAVVLTGAGRGFCAGADVTEFAGMSLGAHPEAAEARARLTTRLHAAFVGIEVPVICAVNGVAMGGGCGLALAGDMAVAAESAAFGYPEAKRNLVRQVGRKAAYELVSLGEKVDAQRALALGMVNRVVPDGAALPEALRMAAAIASQSRPVQRATKRLFHRVADMKLLDALEIGRDANLMMRGRSIKGTV